MSKPKGFSRQLGLSFDRGPYRYALVPWTWEVNQGPHHWRLPSSALGGVDLRSIPHQSIAGGSPQGFAFAACLANPGGNLIATVPHMGEANTTSAMQDAWEAATDYRPAGAKLVDLLFDQLTTGSDPSGQSGPKPLVPGTDGLLKLYVGGHSLVKSEAFRWGVHPHTNRLRDLLRRDFGEQWERTNGHDHCRRCLDYTCKKYGVDDWHEFVPQRLHQHVPGRLPHATTITESFNQADSTTLGPNLTWTEVVGGWRTVSNEVDFETAGIGYARAESDLSSDDHYVQVKLTNVSGGDPLLGVCARFAAAASTFYTAFWYEGDGKLYLRKYVTGTPTDLTSALQSVTLPETHKVEVDGSTVKGYTAGVERLSATDSSITGNTRGGLIGNDGSGSTAIGDDFEAADLAAAYTGDTFPYNEVSRPDLRSWVAVPY